MLGKRDIPVAIVFEVIRTGEGWLMERSEEKDGQESTEGYVRRGILCLLHPFLSRKRTFRNNMENLPEDLFVE